MTRRHVGAWELVGPLRHTINDDLHTVVAVDLVLDGGESAEEELATEGKNGGAAARDATLHQKRGELGDKVVDSDGGIELGELVAEGRAEVDGVGLGVAEGEVTKAEAGIGVQGDRATAAA